MAKKKAKRRHKTTNGLLNGHNYYRPIVVRQYGPVVPPPAPPDPGP